MIFRDWRFFTIALVTCFGIVNYVLISQNLSGLVNKTDMLLPLAIVIGITLVCRAIFPDTPPLWLKILLTLGVSFMNCRYLYWRVSETLVLEWYDAPVSLAVFLMELLAIFNVTIINYQTLLPTNRSREADKGMQRVRSGEYTPSVDVFIPTYNEPDFVLRRTIVGAQAMRYHNKEVWLLDDGRRPEIAEMANELGCHYLTRPDSSHAKAGNLNNGLAASDGEIVVVFDADFIPLEHFLERTVGFFEDPDVSMVVTPQNFYNPDQPEINLGGRILPHEQTMFYDVIQPGRDLTNSVVCTGTSSIMRRSHLDAIGGIPTGTIVEDWSTGMMLQAAGYKTYYLNEFLSVGAAPENFSAYLVQRVRWAEGTLKNLFTPYNPLTLKGLNLIQRINHLSGIVYWIDQALQSISYFIPILCILTGMRAMDTTLQEIIFYWLPNYIGGIILVSWIIGSRTIIVSYTYNALQCFYLVPVIINTFLFPKRKVKFKVTAKGLTADQTNIDFRLMAPIIILLIVNLLSALIIIFTTDFQNFDNGFINLFWCEFNTLVLGISLIAGVNLIEERHAIRVKCDDDCNISTEEIFSISKLIDISESGAALYTPNNLSLSIGQILELSVPGEPFNLKAEVKRTGEITACQFLNLTLEQQRQLIEFMYSRPHHWQKPKVANEFKALQALVISIFELYPLQKLR